MRRTAHDDAHATNVRRWAGLAPAGVIVICLQLAACAGALAPDGSLSLGEAQKAVPAGEATKDGAAAAVAGKVELSHKGGAAQNETKAALEESRKLKASGKRKEALVALEKAAASNPGDRALQVEQGLLSLELGQARKAQRLLASDGADPGKDWRVLSGLGVAHASQGRQGEAQKYFKQALAISPDNPTVLNNLAMSLILERKLDEAEVLLRKASAAAPQSPQLTKNLALAQAIKAQGGEASATP